MRENFDISVKVNKVLNVIILGFLLILLRVWYLAVVQRDEFVQQSHKPQRRTGIEHVERATIRDRFNIPLALNRTQYNVAVRYADIRQVPRSEWVADAQGKRVRKLTRMEHIQKLAKLLAGELGLDPIAIEDTIHGKASLFPQTPFVIKEDITESQYYRLKMLEKQWAGIQTERVSKRFYPHGKLACDILGYMGAISQSEYMRIAGEIKELQDYIALRDE